MMERRFRLTAGLSDIEDYPRYVAAGTDEVFAGYVPSSWQIRHGLSVPLNRREVCFSDVQLGSESELEILGEMQKRYGAKVSLTFNSPFYPEVLYTEISDIMRRCMDLGFSSFIVADFGLLEHLSREGLSKDMDIHVSGEIGVLNRYLLEDLFSFGADRVIFQRKTPVSDMKKLHTLFPSLEKEAFILNEMCHFDGAYCTSLHKDELPPICRERYILSSKDGKERISVREKDAPEKYIPGQGGCGLCALPELKAAGVSVLKIVGRGAFSSQMEKDIRAVRKALDILETTESSEQYRQRLKKDLFLDGCSGNCYYRGL